MDGVGFVVLLYLARAWPSEFRVVFGCVIGACSGSAHAAIPGAADVQTVGS
jgi:hypothetical protein